jgi:hypothetical protein
MRAFGVLGFAAVVSITLIHSVKGIRSATRHLFLLAQGAEVSCRRASGIGTPVSV